MSGFTMKNTRNIACLALTLALAGGCGGENGRRAAAEAEPDYAAEAKKTITTENMDRHLDELEAEIVTDEAAIERE